MPVAVLYGAARPLSTVTRQPFPQALAQQLETLRLATDCL
jgi:hypothetical protein